MVTFLLLLAALTKGEESMVNVIRGQPAVISCNYTGAYVQVSWRGDEQTTRRKSITKTIFLRVRNEEPNSFDDSWSFEKQDSSYNGLSESTLTISKEAVDFGDQGYYECANVTKFITGRFKLNIISLPQISLETETSKGVENDPELIIGTCTAKNAKPAAKITWVNDRGETFAGRQSESTKSGNLSTTTSQLILSDINYEDHAERSYRCLAEQNGQVAAQSAWSEKLRIEYAPKAVAIDVVSLNATANETAIFAGDEVVLRCQAESDPRSEIEWLFFDNENKTSLEHWSSEGELLQTPAVQMSDATVKFICISKNQHGQKTSEFSLSVKEPVTTAAGMIGLVWVLVGVTGVLVVVGLCGLLNRHLKQRRSGIYKTEGHLGDGSRESLTDEIGANTKKEYFM